MKRGFLILISISYFLPALAQRDSILVVIECDSLYRPFLECGIYADVEISGKKKKIRYMVNLDSNLSFYIPRLDATGCYMDVRIYSKELNTFSGWLDYERASTLDNWTFMFPNSSCDYNQSAINNTCSNCLRNDNVSRIVYDVDVDLNSKINFCNPYNNPFVLPHILRLPDNENCQPHCYCNRCKREY